MTVSSEVGRNDYVGNGTTPTYDYTFQIFADTDLLVVVRSAAGVETELTLGTHYTVSGAGDASGGSIALVAGSFSWLDVGNDLSSGTALAAIRRLPLTQGMDLRNQGRYFAEDVETSQDRDRMVDLQQQDEIDRSLKLPDSENVAAGDATLPSAADRKGRFLAFDPITGLPIAATALSSTTPATVFGEALIADANAALGRETLGTSGVVSTIAALRALTGDALAGSYILLGHSAAGDGGGGIYRWIAADAATDNGGTIIAPAVGGGRFYRVSSGEAYHVRWFGAVGDGATNDYTAILACIAAAAAAKVGVQFDGATYATATGIAITNGVGNVPRFVDGRGATLKAITGVGANPLVKIENPHGVVPGFRFGGFKLDGNGIATIPFYLHGAQRCEFFNLQAVKGTSYGFHFSGETGYGIYYNQFSNMRTGAGYSDANGSNGFHIVSIGAGYFFAANDLVCCASDYNKGHGYKVDYASPTFIGCSAEINDAFGWDIDHALSVDILGGYSEFNHQNRTTLADNIGDGTTDESINCSGNSTGVKVIGGRHIGDPFSGTWSGAGMFDMHGRGTLVPALDPTGLFIAEFLRSRGGLGIAGAGPVTGGVNSGGDAGVVPLQLAGTTILGLKAPASGQAGLLLRADTGGGAALVQVTLGIADSGGAGFRLLRIPN